ncbi:nitrogen fixation protein NifX [Cohaesibacter sp. ES.047]|uniref:dinitrogenase iron-molybdenum cofactor biosynthesis protein n=1 Tax=Cohaesibacter sp. ES.047 TaxID=1798205 RepID=UPI000BB8A8FF|nr:dinitrogenase iron-molybdenum cofactor biosynthesis protein [Cohaesibacter sp. ES.047]SNY92922.1 nitrogen fixation protein NifX [Cohaesibacter sp. ES.047]
MTTPLSRELALRIGLAANQMPELDTGSLIGILSEAVGVPMTEEKFANLGMKTFRKAGGEALMQVPSDHVKAALRILKGEGIEAEEPALALDTYEDGDMPGSIRVACASNRAEELDGHFGSCNRFVIYQVSATELRLIDERSTEKPDDVEDKNKWRASLIADCDVVYVASIGGPAAAKVVRANIHPVKHLTGGEARNVLGKLQQVLASSPPPWLARIMGQEAKSMAGFLEEVDE